MKSYFADPDLKASMLKEMSWHQEQDKIIQGTYQQGTNGDFRGCSIGCAIHSLARLKGEKLDTSKHVTLEKYLNIPEHLWHLNDAIFEALPIERAKQWPLQFLEVIPVGADLSMTQVHFMYWLLSDENDGVIRFAGKYDDVHAAIVNVAALLARTIDGEPVSQDQWSAAWSAADSAADSAARSAAWLAAESAARSAAWSAADSAAWSAARSAAESAAWSAAESAAWSAARSAADSAAWSAARSAARIKQADKLLELLRQAPVLERIIP